MNLQDTIKLYAGGPGSGCNPEAGTCGRPRTVYHGMRGDLTEKILKEGLRHQDFSQFAFQNIKQPKGHVFVSTDEDLAKWYAGVNMPNFSGRRAFWVLKPGFKAPDPDQQSSPAVSPIEEVFPEEHAVVEFNLSKAMSSKLIADDREQPDNKQIKNRSFSLEGDIPASVIHEIKVYGRRGNLLRTIVPKKTKGVS